MKWSKKFMARFYASANQRKGSMFVTRAADSQSASLSRWETSKMAESLQYKPPGLEPWDIVIVVLYFFIILGVGLYVSITVRSAVSNNRFVSLIHITPRSLE